MPKYAAALCLAALFLSAATRSDDDDPEPRAKAVKPRAVRAGPFLGALSSHDRPTRITTEKELAEAIPNEKARAAVLKAVDFKKEHLLHFSWSGPRGDRLDPAEGKAGEANFTFTPGKTMDKARHVGLYAVPASAKVKVTTR